MHGLASQDVGIASFTATDVLRMTCFIATRNVSYPRFIPQASRAEWVNWFYHLPISVTDACNAVKKNQQFRSIATADSRPE